MSVISAFENWSLKFVNNAEDLESSGNYGELMCRVLAAVDEAFFGLLAKKQATATEIEEKVCEYLRKFLQIGRKQLLEAGLEVDMMSESELEQLFALVFELCMRADQAATVGHIVQLSNHDQQTLLPLVKQIIEERQLTQVGSPRALSIKLKTEQSDISFMSELERREHQVRQLTERNEILERLLKQANEKYEIFQEENNRMYEQLEQIRLDKQPLLDEVGLPHSVSYFDILERVKQIKRQYEADIDTLHHTVEQQRKELDHNSYEMEIISHSLVQLKKQSLRARDTQVEDSLRAELQMMEVEINTLNFELKQLTTEMRRMKDDNDKLRRKCHKLEPIFVKYKTLENLHNSFRTGVKRCMEQVS